MTLYDDLREQDEIRRLTNRTRPQRHGIVPRAEAEAPFFVRQRASGPSLVDSLYIEDAIGCAIERGLLVYDVRGREVR